MPSNELYISKKKYENSHTYIKPENSLQFRNVEKKCFMPTAEGDIFVKKKMKNNIAIVSEQRPQHI